MKIRWPEVAGARWIAYGHEVRVEADGTVVSHPSVIKLYAENLPHLVQIVEDEPEETVEDVETTPEPEPVPEAAEEHAEASEPEPAPEPEVAVEPEEAPPEPEPEPEPEEEAEAAPSPEIEDMTDGELRELAKSLGVKLGRTKARNKIVAKLKKALEKAEEA